MMIGASAFIAGTTTLSKILGLDFAGERLHPLQISAGRFVFALLAIVVASIWLRLDANNVPWRLHLARTVFGWLGITCIFAAAARIPLADATAISFLSPLVTMVLAIPLLAERVGPIRWTAAAICVIGALILIRPGTSAFQHAAIIALVAALLMGVEAILIKRLSGIEPAIRILLVNNFLGSVLALSAAYFFWTSPSPTQWLLLAFLGLTMAAAQSLFIQAMKGAEASLVSPFFYSTLLFATFYDFSLFGELPGPASLIGAALILAGAILLAIRESKSGQENGSRDKVATADGPVHPDNGRP